MILTIVVFPSWISTTTEIKGKNQVSHLIRNREFQITAQILHMQKIGAFGLHSPTVPTWERKRAGFISKCQGSVPSRLGGGKPRCPSNTISLGLRVSTLFLSF